MCVVIYR
ncbi:hypothetical protein M8C21_019702 [Ambrosia artemisiifolia]|nr:hypothetical protein M8C21_019702 [Ambrosia artemisiifolia]